MSAQLLERCGLCASENLEPVLSLGASPPTCVMAPVGQRPATEEFHPVELVRCSECTLVQLSVVVDPEVVFPVDYPYSSGNSRQLHDNFTELADNAVGLAGLGSGDVVVDIGANDGTLLRKFPDEVTTVGVEPTGQAARIDGPYFQTFFTERLARQIRQEFGPAKVITACNVLAHVADLHNVMRGIRLLLDDDGILITENHDLRALVDGSQWDFIYHEHLRYFDPYSFTALLGWHGLTVRDIKSTATHGGSVRTVAQPGKPVGSPTAPTYDFDSLAEKAASTRRTLRWLGQTPPWRMWGIGATARATTFVNYCGMDVQDLECVCEVPGSDKIGRYIPGTSIPVVSEDRLFEEQPERVLLFSWHLADYIVPKLRDRGYLGEILVPLPNVQILVHTATPATPTKETVR